MVSDCNKLKKTSAKSFEINSNGFTAKVEREKENLVFFSIPYDKGWSATVNGAPCEIEKVNVGFMAVKVPAGESEIVFTYKTPGLILGIEISVISLLLFLLYVIFVARYRRKALMNTDEIFSDSETLNAEKQEKAKQRKLEKKQRKRDPFLDSMYDVNINSRKQRFDDGDGIDIYSDKSKGN
jgi:hypothetical protein